MKDKEINKLEGFINVRPSKEELVERNILKDSQIAPSLLSKQMELERHQLEDNLDHAVSHRPTAEELQARGILK
ncbi:hypothetical protein WALSEDRAFT_69577 [Wallemia mellicola CBS 633.66]|uniref:RPEL repeat protein n=2 Tax=Wallemia mellicola TaxID=1708541 RepID=A0A4T0LHT0_9BASI|nr:hypothetical protein WALSEDRAFT_69577 [Wallemia mellicola CBS 633.66]TIB69029.1 hypothetical protein E3Q24_03465 [Wallemia mellicola]EIM20649.1 hypothetical protein WALSEDRAFT_69577 [Wallemia mellicola CBS 633.66]TIB72087.1 hypothetical protein E3Q23_03515 [Wallemia mellicola]TIB80788.1 hypothetical protein E3Q21_03605 [Wallemia mellicola]TIB84833.1 hypothetical protein E3Q20_03519 [Wallemia mellicola]|eukprot:XP_006959184.1 hypothetical protein WALSEDRAFT_69577 [Wallemia mellicola CBS 633.66]